MLNFSEMNNNINIISIEGITMYTCKKCDEMSKRRYNMERHFRRFHETILPGKTCCGKYFSYLLRYIAMKCSVYKIMKNSIPFPEK